MNNQHRNKISKPQAPTTPFALSPTRAPPNSITSFKNQEPPSITPSAQKAVRRPEKLLPQIKNHKIRAILKEACTQTGTTTISKTSIHQI